MGNQDEELRAAVQAFCDEEGISFDEAVKVAVNTLKLEVQRRKRFQGAPISSGGTST